MASQADSRIATTEPVGRLAPSPTGKLHLGNARTFLLAWLSIRQQRGIMLLRMEDIDSDRVKPGAAQAVIDDLRWLGLDWDYGPDIGDGKFKEVPLTQSLRLERYRDALKQLTVDRRVYRCTCTRSQIAQQIASAPHESGWTQLEGPVYPGSCRVQLERSPTTVEFSASDSAALRWAFEPGSVQWQDQLRGLQSADPSRQLGDFVIGRANGLPSYQLAVVVDDYDHHVTEIVRGDDLILSTFRQQAILHHFGWPSPDYYHVPLLHGANGERLAKRRGDSLEFLRRNGESPERVVGQLASSVGMIDKNENVSATELIGALEWSKLSLQ